MPQRVARHARQLYRSAFADYPQLAPFLAFFLAALLTLISVVTNERNERAKVRLRSKVVAEQVAAHVSAKVAATLAVLRAGRIITEESGNSDLETFGRFGTQVAEVQLFRGALGTGWAAWVMPNQRAAFEQRMSALYGQPFTIWPRTDTADAMVPVTVLNPDTPANRRARGFDMASENRRRAAILAAADSGAPKATRTLRLVQNADGDTLPGMLIYMPVYYGERSGKGAPSRDRIVGFVYAPIRIADLIGFPDGTVPSDVTLRIFDADEQIAGPVDRSGAPYASVATQVAIVDRQWTVTASIPVASGLHPFSWVLLGTGLTIGGLLALLTWLNIARAKAMQEWLAETASQNAIRETLTRELNHRVKNTLANVLSIVALTRRNAKSLDDYADVLTGRLQALSATHDLLTGSDWSETDVRDIVEAELAPYRGAQISFTGEQVLVQPSDAMSLGLAIHELTTNAAKYGALSTTEGQVDVSWEPISDNTIALHWKERNGPAVVAPTRRGFGSTLIERIIAQQLGRPVEMRFDPDGLYCRIEVPVRLRRAFRLREENRAST